MNSPEKKQNEPTYWPYSERNGAEVEQYVAELFSEPSLHLSEADQQAARLFSEQLCTGWCSEGLKANTTRRLQDIQAINPAVYRYTFYEGYLERLNAARIALGVILPQEAAGLGTAQLTDDLRRKVANGEEIDREPLQAFAAASKSWYRGRLTDRLLEIPEKDKDQPDFGMEFVNVLPDSVLDKCADLQAYRQFYHAVRRSLKAESDSPLLRAKQTHLNIHYARVNNILAQQYPNVVQLAKQLDDSPITERTVAWHQKLYEVAPAVASAWKHQRNDHFGEDFAIRLDRVRNGVGLDDEGHFTPVSSLLEQYADELEAAGWVGEFTQPSQVSPEVIERLKKIRWNADQLQTLLQEVLREHTMLSDEISAWHTAAERTAPATDNKWQVIQTPQVDSLKVDDTIKVMWVPENFDRALLQQSPAGALPVAAHELGHVQQGEYDAVMAQHIPLAAIKGRRTLTMRELGGVHQESLVQEYFGNVRPINTTYLRAFQAKLAGGNETETARAFLQARLRTQPASNPRTQARAATQSLRLEEHGGFNSQPLDYITQGFVLKALQQSLNKDEITALTLAGSSFSLEEAAALHRAGLLELPRSVTWVPAEEVIRTYFEKFNDSSKEGVLVGEKL
jgi:hypothetical protein